MSKYIKLEDVIHNLNMVVVGRTEYTEKMKADLFFAIDNLQTIEISEDAISRATVLDIYSDLYWTDERLLNFKDELDKVYEKLRNAPSIIPQVPKEKSTIERVRDELLGLDFDFGDFYDNTETIHERIAEVFEKHSVIPKEKEGE